MLSSLLKLNIILPCEYNDWAEPWQLLFEDPASPITEVIVNLHHDIMFISFFIVIFITPTMLAACCHILHPKLNISRIFIDILSNIIRVFNVSQLVSSPFSNGVYLIFFNFMVYYYIAYACYSFISLLLSFCNISYILLEQWFNISQHNYDLISYFGTVSQYTGTNNADDSILKTDRDVSDAEKLLWALSPWLIYYSLKLGRCLFKYLWKLFFGEDDSSDDQSGGGKPGGGGGGSAAAISPNDKISSPATPVVLPIEVINNPNVEVPSHAEQKVDEIVQTNSIDVSQTISLGELKDKIQEVLQKYVGTSRWTWVSVSEFLGHFNEPFKPVAFKIFSHLKEFACSSNLKTKVALQDNGEGLLALLDEATVASNNLNILTFQDTSLVLPMWAIYLVVKVVVSVYTYNPSLLV